MKMLCARRLGFSGYVNFRICGVLSTTMSKKCFNSSIAVFLCFFTFIHNARGVTITNVGLESGLSYAASRSKAHFSFNVSLEPNEELKSVEWSKAKGSGYYEWSKEGNESSGVFDVPEFKTSSVKDGEFMFEPVRLTQAGNYTINVTTNLGSDTSTFEFIVFHYSNAISSFGQIYFCKWNMSVFVSNMAPYPNFTCTFEDGISGDVVKVSQLAELNENITDLHTGTYDYEISPSIPVVDVPLESFFTCRQWMKNSNFQLVRFKTSEVMGEPCSAPLNRTGFSHKLWTGKESCRGGYLQLTTFNYSCNNDPMKKPVKTIKCEKRRIWKETDDLPWRDCENNCTRSINGKSCPNPSDRKKFVYTMENGDKSCQGGYIPSTVLSYFCAHSNNKKELKSLICHTDGKWEEIPGTTWPICPSGCQNLRIWLPSLLMIILPIYFFVH